MSFLDSTRFIFWIFVETCSYESFEGFHAIFEIFGFLYEQWSQIGVGIEKIGTILDSLKFGTADSPRVRGGQSAKGPRTVRLCWAVFYQRQFQSVGSVKNSTADGPPGYRGQSATGQKGGVGQTWLILDVPLTPLHQTAHKQPKALSLSLSNMWGRQQGQGFLAWFPDGPSTSPDSSQDCASCPIGISMNP